MARKNHDLLQRISDEHTLQLSTTEQSTTSGYPLGRLTDKTPTAGVHVGQIVEIIGQA
jgi:hypothetical protein